MNIKSTEIVSVKAGNVGWIEKLYKFDTGQKATWHTHTHRIKCFNGIGKDITDTELGQKLVQAIKTHQQLNDE
jgi:hypothetical protein